MSAAPSLRDWIMRSVERPQKGRLRISQAGKDCPREVYYLASDTPPSEPTKDESKIKMAVGSAFDAYSLPAGTAIAHPNGANPPTGWEFQKPVVVKMGGLEISGTADAVFFRAECDEKRTRTPLHIADLKTVGALSFDKEKQRWEVGGTWKKIQKAAKQEHVAQVNLYAYGLGAKTWSVLYVNADTGEMLEHFGVMDEFAARRDFGLFEEVSYWLHRGEAPPRPFADIENGDGTVKLAKDGFPCAWCSFKTTCWSEGE